MQKKAVAAVGIACLCVVAVLVVVDQAPATTIKASEEGGAAVIHAIVDLKAYSMEAAPLVDAKFKDEHKSGAIDLVEVLGKHHAKEPEAIEKPSEDVDLVTEFAQAMGDLLAKHPRGMANYLLHHIYDNILAGKSVVQSGTGGYSGKMMFNGDLLGLRETPQYLYELSVSSSSYGTTRVNLHEGTGGKAIAAWEKSSKLNAYHEYYNKLKAQYMQQQQAEDLLQEEGAKVALHASFETGWDEGKGNQEVMSPLPSAGAAGGMAVRKKRAFHMPTEDEIAEEAKAMAKKYMAEVATEGLSPEFVISKIEGEMEGTTIKISTSPEMFADSNESPTIKIVGSKGAIESKIDALPLNGQEMTQTFAHDGGSIGKVESVTITPDAAVTNPWLCTGFSVQVGHGSAWLDIMPKDTKAFWLDGRSEEDQTGPYFGAPHKSEWVLAPGSA